jgi:D-alanine-D-alanine ligase
VSYLEVLGVPYTGCNPRGLMLSRDKALSKALLAYHRIPIAPFAVYRRGTRVRRPKKLKFPLFVKPLGQDGSIGISQASVVENEDQFQERIRFVHDKVPSDAIVEHYIEGREIYVGVLGNHRLQVFPPWELNFEDMGQSRAIATDRAKWSEKYQEKHGITAGPAENLPTAVQRQLPRLCKRIYRTLDMCGYARIDFRLTEEGRLFVIEVNANPHIAHDEYFAESAGKVGIAYDALLHRIIQCGLRWRPGRLG